RRPWRSSAAGRDMGRERAEEIGGAPCGEGRHRNPGAHRPALSLVTRDRLQAAYWQSCTSAIALSPLQIGGSGSTSPASRLPLLDDSLRIDLLVNCAGVLHSGERFGSLDPAIVEDSFRTNAMGPLLLTQALEPWLADGARVANLSSVLGSIASLARFGTPSYDISKCAQNMVTALLAQALQPRGIVVLALHPGWARTEMGGEKATVPVADSVAGMLRVVAGATGDDSGAFRDWQGRTLPW